MRLKKFEDRFMDLQADMIDICMEFVDYDADKIYIYCSCEGRMNAADFFYKIEGQLVDRNLVNTVSYRECATYENELTCLDVLLKDIAKMEKLCAECERPMPTEIKMIYEVKENSLEVKYQYENQLNYEDANSDRIPSDVSKEWYLEIEESE